MQTLTHKIGAFEIHSDKANMGNSKLITPSVRAEHGSGSGPTQAIRTNPISYKIGLILTVFCLRIMQITGGSVGSNQVELTHFGFFFQILT